MMKIVEIPCLEDNYSYLIIDETSKEAAVVDPVEPDEIVDFAQQQGLLLKMVLTMHHHWIRQMLPCIKVYGGSIANVRVCTHKLDNRDRLSLGTHINITALHTPCYYVTTKDEDIPAVLTGDTLNICIIWLVASQIGTKVYAGKYFIALLDDVITAEASDEVSADGKTILTSWSTAKQLLKSDPRYSKMLRKERENLWLYNDGCDYTNSSNNGEYKTSSNQEAAEATVRTLKFKKFEGVEDTLQH
ncbi:hypothetical protein MKX01_026529 [Papaver californicum]|nr:hypothetical protein MKX01_026529 [Papaver californicum]